MLSWLSMVTQDIEKVCVDISEKYGTPFYLYSEADIKQNFRTFTNAFSDYEKTKIAYSMKNCFIPGIVCSLSTFEPLFEVTSLGEMMLLKQMGKSMRNCIYTSMYKPNEAIEYALKNDLGLYAIDSNFDFDNLRDACIKLGKHADVLIRINPAIESITNTIFASAVPWSKMGLDINNEGSDSAETLIVRAQQEKVFTLRGLHAHLGSQVTDIRYYKEFIMRILDFYKRISKKYDLKMDYLDLGGGYPAKYIEEEDIISIREIANVIVSAINKAKLNLTLILESGRYMTSNAGILVTKIVGIKHNPTIGKIIVVDSSFYNHLLDSILVNWHYEIEKLHTTTASNEQVHIVGCTNDSIDQLDSLTTAICPFCKKNITEKRVRRLPITNIGDLLIVKNAGAYTTCFNSNYCLLPTPPVFLVTDRGEINEVKRCETITGMFRLFSNNIV